MRAAILLVPLVAAAAIAVAGAPPGHGPPDDYNMVMTMDTNAADMNAVDYNVVGAPIGPDWLADGEWIYGGTEVSGVSWFIDLRASDLEARPIRIRVRSDEAAVAGSRFGFTERDLTIDCAKYRYRVVRTRHYDRDGNGAGPEEAGGGPLGRAAPGSVYAEVAQSACFHGGLADEMLANTAEITMNGM